MKEQHKTELGKKTYKVAKVKEKLEIQGNKSL